MALARCLGCLIARRSAPSACRATGAARAAGFIGLIGRATALGYSSAMTKRTFVRCRRWVRPREPADVAGPPRSFDEEDVAQPARACTSSTGQCASAARWVLHVCFTTRARAHHTQDTRPRDDHRRSDHSALGGGAAGVAAVWPSSVHAGRSFNSQMSALLRAPRPRPPLGPPPRRAAAHAGPHVRRALLLTVVEGAVAVDDLELVLGRRNYTTRRARASSSCALLAVSVVVAAASSGVGTFVTARARSRACEHSVAVRALLSARGQRPPAMLQWAASIYAYSNIARRVRRRVRARAASGAHKRS